MCRGHVCLDAPSGHGSVQVQDHPGRAQLGYGTQVFSESGFGVMVPLSPPNPEGPTIKKS